ncbi:MAG: TPM domain-containing protein [Ruminococcaceae bacterium]|nr:TPM domain-containing protein [Oscillospiraceae bacterium]
MRKVYIYLVMLICLTLVIPTVCTATAYNQPDYVTDNAGVLTKGEISSLCVKLEEISDRHSVSVAVFITDDMVDPDSGREFTDIDEYAEYLFDNYSYGYGETDDGILFVISLGGRDWCVFAAGYGDTVMNSRGFDQVENEIIPYLSDGEYYRAFSHFGDVCDELITDSYGSSVTSGKWILTCFIVGLVISIITVGIMASMNKSVRYGVSANSYIVNGSFSLTEKQDIFLYRNVMRTPRQTSESSRGSRSGGSSSGRSSRSGKF